MQQNFIPRVHPVQARIYGRIASLFSKCSARTLNCSEPLLWSEDSLAEGGIVLGRAVPEILLTLFSNRPLYVPGGWTIYGFSSNPALSLSKQNTKLSSEGVLPRGWLCIANIADDDYYFLTDLHGDLVADAPVVRADPRDFHALSSKAEPVATSIAEFLLSQIGDMVVELEGFVREASSEHRTLEQLIRQHLAR